ncbi:MAG: UDP-glucose 4-epimerase GalE [Cyanobacteria bacterium SZAS LIN-3]|nr:UDP-glucose 4-epimerase GalE [Cyanobacteria bacterium SZAS LIN-3]
MLLITGACGYIGSHFLHHYLAQTDEKVVVIDDLMLGHVQAITPDIAPRVHFAQCRIGDREAVAELLAEHKVDRVVHFAASAYVGESQENPFKYFNNNVVQSLAFFESLEAAGVRDIVFSSTCASYGTPAHTPIDESHPQMPINTYGVSKLMIEHALRALALAKGWRYVLLRYFNAAGASASAAIGESHATETHLIPLALAAAMGKGPALKVYGNDYPTADGTCIRDYVHVDDLATGHMRALDLLKNPRMPAAACLPASDELGAVFNLGTSKGASVLEVIKMVETVTGLTVPYSFAPRRPGDPAVLTAVDERARTVLGWKAEHDLESIVRTAFAWEQKRTY